MHLEPFFLLWILEFYFTKLYLFFRLHSELHDIIFWHIHCCCYFAPRTNGCWILEPFVVLVIVFFFGRCWYTTDFYNSVCPMPCLPAVNSIFIDLSLILQAFFKYVLKVNLLLIICLFLVSMKIVAVLGSKIYSFVK